MSWLIAFLVLTLGYILLKNLWAPVTRLLGASAAPMLVLLGARCVEDEPGKGLRLSPGATTRHMAWATFFGAMWMFVPGFYVGRVIVWREYLPLWYWAVNAFLLLLALAFIVWTIRLYRRHPVLHHHNRFFGAAALLTSASFLIGALTTGIVLDSLGKKALSDAKKEVLAAGYRLDPPPKAPSLLDQDNAIYWIQQALLSPSMSGLYSKDPSSGPKDVPFSRWESERAFLSDLQRDLSRGVLTIEKREAARILVRRHADALRFLEKAYLVRKCDWKYDRADLDHYGGQFHSIGYHIVLARLVLCRAAVRLESGEVDRALRDMRLVFFLGEASGEMRDLIGNAVDNAIQGMVIRFLKGFVLTRVNGFRLEKEGVIGLRPERVRAGFMEALVFDYFVFRRLLEVRYLESWDGFKAYRKDTSLGRWETWFWSSHRWVLYFDYAAMYRNNLQQMRCFAVPYPDLAPKWEDAEDRFRKTTWLSGSISHMSYTLPYEKVLGVVASGRLAEAAIRVKLFREKSGRWPKTLAEVPGLTLKKRMDPFTASSEFIYRPSGKGVVLYSVGEDGVDDGGREKENERGTKGYDLVWKLP